MFDKLRWAIEEKLDNPKIGTPLLGILAVLNLGVVFYVGDTTASSRSNSRARLAHEQSREIQQRLGRILGEGTEYAKNEWTNKLAGENGISPFLRDNTQVLPGEHTQIGGYTVTTPDKVYTDNNGDGYMDKIDGENGDVQYLTFDINGPDQLTAQKAVLSILSQVR